MRLSEHFTLEELTRSQTAARLGINNTPDPQYIPRLVALCERVLEPIRAHFGPVVVTSGYRTPRLNQLIGGAPNSQHQYCEAADIVVLGRTPLEVSRWVRDNLSVFDQVIHEYDSWTHVSYTERYPNRKEVLTINKDGAFKGLEV